ncbi:hypothetical protein INR49_012944, partial [Caranx melampygus]
PDVRGAPSCTESLAGDDDDDDDDDFLDPTPQTRGFNVQPLNCMAGAVREHSARAAMMKESIPARPLCYMWSSANPNRGAGATVSESWTEQERLPVGSRVASAECGAALRALLQGNAQERLFTAQRSRLSTVVTQPGRCRQDSTFRFYVALWQIFIQIGSISLHASLGDSGRPGLACHSDPPAQKLQPDTQFHRNKHEIDSQGSNTVRVRLEVHNCGIRPSSLHCQAEFKMGSLCVWRSLHFPLAKEQQQLLLTSLATALRKRWTSGLGQKEGGFGGEGERKGGIRVGSPTLPCGALSQPLELQMKG